MAKLVKTEIEQRSGAAWATDLRVLPGNKTGPVLEWYPIVYGVISEGLGGFVEVIRPGAATKSLKSGDIRGLFNHNASFVLGRTKAGTLELTENGRGVLARAKLPDTSWARDLAESVKRGDVNQGSFAFRVIKEAWTTLAGDSLRELLELDLIDVSLVTFPAYPQTAGAAMRGARALKRFTDSKILQARRRWLDQISKT
jgi:HK97 family phage prohead protease